MQNQLLKLLAHPIEKATVVNSDFGYGYRDHHEKVGELVRESHKVMVPGSALDSGICFAFLRANTPESF